MSKSEAIGADDLPASGTSTKRWWRRLILYPTAIGAIPGAIPAGIDLYKASAGASCRSPLNTKKTAWNQCRA